MRKNIVVTGFTIAALVAAGGAPVYAQSTTGEKIEQKTEEAKDKAKSMGHEAKAGMTDSWITSKTKIALFSDDRVKGTQVHVETQKGTVMLRGKVDSNEAKAAAAEVAQGIEGVKSVKDRFKQDPDLKKAKIDAKVNAGVVTLTGEVKSIGTSARASDVARGIPGVRSVKNDLTYASRSSLEPSGTRK